MSKADELAIGGKFGFHGRVKQDGDDSSRDSGQDYGAGRWSEFQGTFPIKSVEIRL